MGTGTRLQIHLLLSPSCSSFHHTIPLQTYTALARRCHRVLRDWESGLQPNEQALLDRICEAYYLPAWCSIADYERLMRKAGMQVCLHALISLPSLHESGKKAACLPAWAASWSSITPCSESRCHAPANSAALINIHDVNRMS